MTTPTDVLRDVLTFWREFDGPETFDEIRHPALDAALALVGPIAPATITPTDQWSPEELAAMAAQGPTEPLTLNRVPVGAPCPKCGSGWLDHNPGCPVPTPGEPDAIMGRGGADSSATALRAHARARAWAQPHRECGHSACGQHFIDTGETRCIEGEAP